MPAPPGGEAVARRDRRPAGNGPCLLNAAAVGPAPEHPGRLDPQRADAQEPRVARRPDLERSEEHTSALQSLMRISYAVFCLKKKTINVQPDETHITAKIMTKSPTTPLQ